MAICSVMLLWYHYYMCVFVYKVDLRGLVGKLGHGLKLSTSK